MADKAIEAVGVHFGYRPDEPILQDVHFAIETGSIVACIGPNGGGKTTLLRLLLGFLRPNRGTLRLHGLPVQAHRACVAYVPQMQVHDRLFPVTVEDVVLMGLLRDLSWCGRFSSQQKAAAHAILERVGCDHLIHEPFGNLSGGQAQRVLIARALVSQPRILLLDEPTASVDPAAEGMILDLICSLRGKTTVLLVTHDLHTAHRYVDQVLCIHRTASMYHPSHLCEHFSLGLYHPVSLGKVLASRLQAEAPV
ncbi:MAG: metal ABC transporter ATP-binding protein [Chlamydiia bacterium]